MIGTRFAAAVALVLSVAAVALGVAAFMATLRDEETKPGRVLQTRITGAYEGDPVSFPLDEFFLSIDDEGTFHALYAYPPGYFGHTRGCKIVFVAEEAVETPAGRDAGLFVDPCGGARFARDGRLIAGAADRGLDYFETEASVDGWSVDTRTLYCGSPFEPVRPPRATPTPPPASPAPTAAVTAPIGGTGTAALTPTLTATARATSTATVATREGTASPAAERETCERVSAGSKRR